ncbi:antibiotic biosynthesis monooxygenase [uncultured Deefgea sp.]|uniref:antibiotic biosynthesis monooxygenase family protein n=1 Tax=uncultured Deefgea sp. TaxID=1304914 RepID=UPI00262109E4|nr:antibiotic biosynthesis monooxygenase [uncultured Deefgea sp.]
MIYSATFIFDIKQFDAEFHQLDQQIAQAAKETEGYLGEEVWQNAESGRVCNVYYWASDAGLKALMQHPLHLAAKARYSEWLSGYQVIISQVLRSYGDSTINHPCTVGSI